MCAPWGFQGNKWKVAFQVWLGHSDIMILGLCRTPDIHWLIITSLSSSFPISLLFTILFKMTFKTFSPPIPTWIHSNHSFILITPLESFYSKSPMDSRHQIQSQFGLHLIKPLSIIWHSLLPLLWNLASETSPYGSLSTPASSFLHLFLPPFLPVSHPPLLSSPLSLLFFLSFLTSQGKNLY